MFPFHNFFFGGMLVQKYQRNKKEGDTRCFIPYQRSEIISCKTHGKAEDKREAQAKQDLFLGYYEPEEFAKSNAE